MKNLENKVREIIANHFGVSPDALKPETRFIEDLGCDTVDDMELILSIQDEFIINIEDEEYDSIDTVGEVIALVKKKVGEKP